MKSIGIDIGTTTICGVVLDNDNGEILYKETIESHSFIDTSCDLERVQDVEIIVFKAKQLLECCLDKFSDIAYIGLTGQMHGIVYVDALGKAISPLYTWQDQRGQSIVDEINQFTKHKVAAGYGLVTHAYHVKNDNVPIQAVSLCTIMDYFGMTLTKRTTPLMHISNAASLGFWNNENSCFELKVLEKFNIDKNILPATTRNIVTLGNYKNIPVIIALGDNQASFLATSGNHDDVVLVNMGTGGQVSLLVNDYVEVEGVETRPFIEDKYLLVGASLCGGRAYAILENFLRQYVLAATGIEMSQYEIMETLASKVESHENKLKVYTTFNGTRIDPQKLGSIQNISEDNFLPEFIIHAFMDGMINELYDMYQNMSVVNDKVNRLMVSGNAIRKNKVLRKICEDKFGLSSVLAKYEEEAACGAAMSYQYK